MLLLSLCDWTCLPANNISPTLAERPLEGVNGEATISADEWTTEEGPTEELSAKALPDTKY